jgi:hypothetical protein
LPKGLGLTDGENRAEKCHKNGFGLADVASCMLTFTRRPLRERKSAGEEGRRAQRCRKNGLGLADVAS